jgi:capsular polysaccharide biosynthesis protein
MMTQQTLDTRGPDDVDPEERSGGGRDEMQRPPVTLVDAIRAHKLVVALCGLGFALVAAGLTWFTSPGVSASGQLGLVYPASGNVLLPQPAGDATMARYTAQRALFAKSDAVLREVVDSVPGTTLEALRTAVSVTPSKTANAMVVKATADSPEKSLAITQAVMDSYRTATSEDVNARAAASADGWEARGDSARAEQVRIDGASFGDGVEFEASPSVQPQTRLLLNKQVALGLLVGLGFGAMLAWSLEDSRRRRQQRVVREGQ